MKNKQSKLVILNALFFAGLMLLMASLFSNKDNGMMMTHFLIAAWFIANAYLTNDGKCSSRCSTSNKLSDHSSEQ